MVRQLPPWFENLGKRQVKAPKVYVRDSGLLHSLLGITNQRDLEHHPKVGASWEGYAVEEVLKALQPHEAYFSMPRFRAKMNSALAVSSAKKCAAKRQEVIFLPHIFLHRMPFLLESPVKAVVGVHS